MTSQPGQAGTATPGRRYGPSATIAAVAASAASAAAWSRVASSSIAWADPSGHRRARRAAARRHRTAYDRGVSTRDARTPPELPLPLLVLGRGTDLHTERGVECPGDLPAPSDPDLVERARAAKAALGDRVFVLGHHYQRDEVIEFADVTGDSFKLAKDAAARPDAPYIVFCGVHFMAESADILTSDEQTVILPDLAAGCSMADMAAIRQVEDAWDDLVEAGVADRTIPVTYMNSSAAIKAFTGRHGGTICTSSNARTALTWALDQAGRGRQGALPARPAPGPQHLRARARWLPRRVRRVRPAQADGRADPAGARRTRR